RMGCGYVVGVSGSDHDPDYRLKRRLQLGGRKTAAFAAPDHRRWPRPIPSFTAFWRREPSVLLISFAILLTRVLAFECWFSNLRSAAVYGLRIDLFFFALITSVSSCSRIELVL